MIQLQSPASPAAAAARPPKTWCVAKPSADEKALQGNINYVCQNVSCSVIQPGGPCFNPNTLASHASIAMNLYYAYNGRHSWNCYFRDSGIIVQSDPSKPQLATSTTLLAVAEISTAII
jgi:hypothetical protein